MVGPKRPAPGRHTGEARKHFFFEKKKQKTFALLVAGADPAGTYPIE
jgi:hypothetical protein